MRAMTQKVHFFGGGCQLRDSRKENRRIGESANRLLFPSEAMKSGVPETGREYFNLLADVVSPKCSEIRNTFNERERSCEC